MADIETTLVCQNPKWYIILRHSQLETLSAQAISTLPLPMAAVPLSLQVGERKFTTTKATLSKSGFFSALLAGPWEGDLLMDGSYFIDADPDIFDFVLKYLRHGILPLFYDKVKGHDYRLYLAVLEREHILGHFASPFHKISIIRKRIDEYGFILIWGLQSNPWSCSKS